MTGGRGIIYVVANHKRFVPRHFAFLPYIYKGGIATAALVRRRLFDEARRLGVE